MLKSSIIRVLAFTALFAYVMPFLFSAVGLGTSFAFAGGIVAAFGLGVSYMAVMLAMVVVLGSLMHYAGMTDAQRTSIWPVTWLICFAATAAALLCFSAVPFFGLSISVAGSLVGAAIATGVLHFTMPSSFDSTAKS